jgi:hypothetical protein
LSSPSAQIDLSKILTRTNVLRVIAVLFAATVGWGALTTGPKMASASGAPVNDVINKMVIPGLISVVSWIWANWSKVKPSLIKAVLDVYANPKDANADLKLVVEVAAYLKSQWPDVAAFNQLDKFVEDFVPVVVGDITKNLPGPVEG